MRGSVPWVFAPERGYTANAAIHDRRIKAAGRVSAVNIGSMFRNRWEDNIKDAEAIPAYGEGSAHVACARGPLIVSDPGV